MDTVYVEVYSEVSRQVADAIDVLVRESTSRAPFLRLQSSSGTWMRPEMVSSSALREERSRRLQGVTRCIGPTSLDTISSRSGDETFVPRTLRAERHVT